MVEFALILPLFLLMIAVAVDFGRLFYAYVAASNAAKEGAAYGAQNPICTDASVGSGALCPDPANVTWRVASEANNLTLVPTTIQCLAPDGAVRSPMTTCAPGDTYVVHVETEFRPLTPIIGQLLGTGITLGTESQARVLNLAFDPTPGVSVTKLACFGTGCEPDESPFFDGTEDIFAEGMSGDPLSYRVVVQNVGGARLTGMTISDSPATLPLGTAGCPAFPTAMSTGATWQCDYDITAPNTGGPAEILYSNTVTVDANELEEARSDVATVRVIAAPANLVLAKHINVYRLGGSGNGPSFGSATSLTAHRNTQVSTVVVWHRITVTNDGGQDAVGFSLTDSGGALPTNADCPARPTTLGPGQTYTCRFSRSYSAASTNTETATSSADNVTAITASTTSTIQACASPNLVIPHLVGISPRSAVEAAWTAAGFPIGQLSTWGGNPNQTVRTQDVLAYSCVPASQTMDVNP